MFHTRHKLLGIGFGFVLALAQIGHSAAHPAPPVITISDAYVVEGKAVYVSVRLDHDCHTSVTVNYSTADGTAEGGSSYVYDYRPASGTLTFNPGETSKSIRIGTWDDVDLEMDEYFFVNLSGAQGATIGNSQAQVGIADNDGPPAP